MKWSSEFARYLAVGLVNTTVGLALIYLCMAAGFGDVIANLLGYALGLVVSFFLNSKFTFRRQELTQGEFVRFLAVFAVSYLMNLAVMLYVRDHLGWNSAVAQAAGVSAYLAGGYLGMKFVAFRIRR